MKKYLVILITIFLVGCGNLGYAMWSTPPDNNFLPAANQFVGTGDGAGGSITVVIEVDNNIVTNIHVDHSDTPDFANPAIETMIADVISNQTTQIDMVTGATATSLGFLQALQQAFDNAGLIDDDNDEFPNGERFVGTGDGAGGSITVVIEVDNNIVTNIHVEHSDTPDFANPAIETMIADVISNQTKQIDIVTGATATSLGFLQALQQAFDNANIEN